MRMPFNDQRRMLSMVMGIVAFMIIVMMPIYYLPVADWIKDGLTFNPWWVVLVEAVLAVPRFTYYKHAKKDLNNPLS